MKDSLKRKLLGNNLYPVYRRIRFLRYKRKLLKKAKIQFENITHEKPGDEERKVSFWFRIYKIYRLSSFSIRRWNDLRIQKRKKIKFIRQVKRTEHNEIKQRLREKRLQDKLLERQRSREERLLEKQEKKIRRIDARERRNARWNEFIHEIKTFDRHTLRRWFRGILEFAENKDKRHNFFVISVNSLALFLLSYLALYIISQLITVWVAASFDYKTILYYYKIYYDIESHAWNADSVKILFSIMPITGMLMGIIFLILYSTFRNEPGNMKLFFLWGFVHGMVLFFGALLMGSLLNKDFGWVIAYLYYRDTGKMIFSIIAIFALITIGGLIAKSFLISGNSYFNFITKKNRKFLLTAQVIFPVIVGTVLLALIKIPDQFYFGTIDEMYYEFLKLFSLFILIVPLMVAFNTYNEIYFDEEQRRIKLHWISLIIAITLILALRFGLVNGIIFGG